MKSVNNASVKGQVYSSSSGRQSENLEVQPKAGLLQFFPLSLPLSKALKDGLAKLTPISGQHKAVLSTLAETDTRGIKDIQHALHESVEHADDAMAQVSDADFKALMNTTITSQLLVKPYLQEKAGGHSEFKHACTLKSLLEYFKPEHIEVTGSSVKSLIAGHGVPSKASDLDVVIYVDLDKFGKDPQTRNWGILNAYADQCGYPKEPAVRARATIEFINHAFGCTFKPAVDRSTSHTLDITLIDSKLYPMNKTGSVKGHYPRWDQIQSSLKLLSHDGLSAKAQGLLSINALQYLQKRGLVLFNPLLISPNAKKEGALLRVSKAIGPKFQNLSHDKHLHRLQTHLVDDLFTQSSAYDKHQFDMEKVSLDRVPVLSFSELLDEHAEIYKQHHAGQLSIHDAQALDICLAEVAYKALREKPESRQELNQLVYRAQCAAAAGKHSLAEKILHGITSQKIDIAKLHPISQIWLEGLVSHFNFEKPLSSKERLNWLEFAQKSSTHSIEDALKLIDTTKGKSKKAAVSKDEVRKSLAAIKDVKQSCKALVSWLDRHPNESQSIQQLFSKVSKLSIDDAKEFEGAIDKYSSKTLKDPKNALALLELSLSKQRFNQSDFWKDKLSQSLAAVLDYGHSKKGFAELDRLLREHIGDKIYPSAVSKILQEAHRFEEYVQLMAEKAPHTKILPSLQFVLGQSLISNLDHDQALSHEQNKQALHYFELAANSSKTALDAVNAALMVCQKMGDAEKGLDVIAKYMNKLSDTDKQDSVFLDSAREMISMIGSLASEITPETLKCFKQLEPLLGNVDEHDQFEDYGKGLLQLYDQYTYYHRNTLEPRVLEHFNARIQALLEKTKLSDTDKKAIQNNVMRTQGYLLKRQGDAMLLTINTGDVDAKIEKLSEAYRAASQKFNEIDEDFAEDYMHLSEMFYHFEMPENALEVFKEGFKLDQLYVSNHLGSIILQLKDEAKIMQEIDFFKREIVKANLAKQPVAYNLLLQITMAMKGGKDNMFDLASKNEDMAVQLLTICRNTKFIDNKFHCNLSEDNPFNRIQDASFDGLRWAMDACIGAYKKSASKKTEFLDFAIQMVKFNQFMDIDAKLKSLVGIKNSNATEGTYTSAITLRKLVNAQVFALFAASQNAERFRILFADGALVNQIRDYSETISKIVHSFDTFNKSDRQYDQMPRSIATTWHTSLEVNKLPVTNEAIIGLLHSLVDNGHQWHATLGLDLKKNLPKEAIVNAIEDAHGMYANSYLSMSAENMLLLGMMVDRGIGKDALKAISKHIEPEHIKTLRNASLKIFDELESAVRQKKPFNQEHALVYLKAFVLRGDSHFESKDSGRLFVKYKDQVYQSVYGLHELKLDYMRRFAKEIMRNKPDIPASLEADVRRLLK